MSIHRTLFACLVLLLGSVSNGHAADSQHLLRKGIDAYEAGAYRDAANILEQAKMNETATTEHYLWLGRSYGRLAEQSSFLNALSLAIETRRNLELAVELDGRNIAAMEDLLEFYSQAPALVGGGQDKAERLRDRLADLRQTGHDEDHRSSTVVPNRRQARPDSGSTGQVETTPAFTGRNTVDNR